MAEDNVFIYHQNTIASKSSEFLFLVVKMVKNTAVKKSKLCKQYSKFTR